MFSPPTELHATKGALRCDACLSQRTKWTLVVPTYHAVVLGRMVHSDPNWLLCDPCAQLVRADDRVGLARRALRAMLKAHPEPQNAATMDEMLAAQAGMWENMSGEMHPMTELEREDATSSSPIGVELRFNLDTGDVRLCMDTDWARRRARERTSG